MTRNAGAPLKHRRSSAARSLEGRPSGYLLHDIVKALTECTAYCFVVNSGEVELGTHRVDENASLEQPKHKGACLLLISTRGRAVVVRFAVGEDDLRQRPVTNDLCNDLPLFQ